MILHHQSVNNYPVSNIDEPVGSLCTQWPVKKSISCGFTLFSAVSRLTRHVETNVGGKRADCEGRVYVVYTRTIGMIC